MLFEFDKRHPAIHGHTIVDNMQIRLLKVDDALAPRILHIGVADIPFLRNGPIEYLRTGRDFSQLQGNSLLEETKSLTEAITGNTAADGIELRYQAIHRLALSQGIETVLEFAQVQCFQAVLTNRSPDMLGP